MRRSRTAPFPSGFASGPTTPSGTTRCCHSVKLHNRCETWSGRNDKLEPCANVRPSGTTPSDDTGARPVSVSKQLASTHHSSLVFRFSIAPLRYYKPLRTSDSRELRTWRDTSDQSFTRGMLLKEECMEWIGGHVSTPDTHSRRFGSENDISGSHHDGLD